MLAYPHRGTVTIAVFPGVTQFAQMIIDVSTDINDFLDVTADIASSGDGDHKGNTCIRVANVLLEAKLNWLEINQNRSPTDRQEFAEPDIMDLEYTDMREKLANLRRRDKPRAMNFNMETGRVRR